MTREQYNSASEFQREACENEEKGLMVGAGSPFFRFFLASVSCRGFIGWRDRGLAEKMTRWDKELVLALITLHCLDYAMKQLRNETASLAVKIMPRPIHGFTRSTDKTTPSSLSASQSSDPVRSRATMVDWDCARTSKTTVLRQMVGGREFLHGAGYMPRTTARLTVYRRRQCVALESSWNSSVKLGVRISRERVLKAQRKSREKAQVKEMAHPELFVSRHDPRFLSVHLEAGITRGLGVQHGRKILSKSFHGPFYWDCGKTQEAESNAFHRISHHVQFLEPHMDLSTPRSVARIILLLAFQGNDWRGEDEPAHIRRKRLPSTNSVSPPTFCLCGSPTSVIFWQRSQPLLSLFGTKTLRPSNVKEEQHIWELWMSENIGSARFRTSGRIQIGPARKFWCFRLSFRAESAVITRRISNFSFSLDFSQPDCPIPAGKHHS
ncbi:hypothetical protein C8J56DRAFT_1030167, partial [Mycena floridula]